MQETKALISAMTGEARGGSRAAAPGCGFHALGIQQRGITIGGKAEEIPGGDSQGEFKFTE